MGLEMADTMKPDIEKMGRTETALRPSTAYIWRLAGEGLAMCYRASKGYEACLTPYASLILSGEPVADLNYAIIDVAPQAEDRLQEFVRVPRSRKIPVLFLFTPGGAPQLSPVAQALGLEFAAHIPLMVHDAMDFRLREGNFRIARVEGEADLKTTNGVMSKAFKIPIESMERTFGPSYIQGPGVDLFFAQQDGQAMSSVQTTRAGSVVGIWAMATPPEHQRRGAGRALLHHIIAYHRDRGAALFYLMATPEGKPLYDNVGFQTIAEAEVWLLK